MLQLLSRVNLTDNSGVLTGRVIKVLTPKNARLAKIGSLVLISSKTQIKNSGILPGTKLKALVVRTKTNEQNLSHKLIWQENSVILVKAAPKNEEFLPVATRIKAPVSSKLLRLQGYQKVIALAKNYV